jgi:hypothetical protein
LNTAGAESAGVEEISIALASSKVRTVAMVEDRYVGFLSEVPGD